MTEGLSVRFRHNDAPPHIGRVSIDRGEEIHRYRERNEMQIGMPVSHEQYNDALRQLQETGKDIKNALARVDLQG